MNIENNGKIDLSSYNSERDTFKAVEPSGWNCYLFGNKPIGGQGMVYHPKKGQEPNRFIRFMMKICLGCTWIKD